MLNARIPIFGFAAFSGAGKTTLLTHLIPLLKIRGLKIGLIKHSHHSFEIDKPGKDSFRFREAGARSVMLVSRYRRAVITEFENPHEPRLDEQLRQLDQSDLDLILVEGFKSENFPKIEIHRPALNKPLLYPYDSSIIAVASDCKMSLPEPLVFLDINNPAEIAEFILHRIPGYDHD
ncbi:MAG: molybdopterin-guanine dinucleotide biosynthesis protein B [Gammaproteobacteria bacterium]